MIAIVFKVSKTGKTILVGTKVNEYQIGYNFAWSANPHNSKVKDKLQGFNPKGTEAVIGEDGKPVCHEDGSPVLRYTF